MTNTNIYQNITARTGGDIYLGVVGPVRTGKSTFIKRFMDVMVLPQMEDSAAKKRTVDELPQSAQGKTIMTTEPKFIPREAVSLQLEDDVTAKVKLIDCVGYLIDGVNGHMEDGNERMVKTPWFDHEIPFAKAAQIGTEKVIREHATIGLVVTTDGSIGEIPRENYREAEERTVRELQEIGKPFVVLVNSRRPLGEEAGRLARELEETYGVRALPVNCQQLKEEDICRILEAVLYEFPVSEVQFFIPRWVEMLPRDHRIKLDLTEHVKKVLEGLEEIKDAVAGIPAPESEYIEDLRVGHIAMDTGCVRIQVEIGDRFYYETLSELTGLPIAGQYELIQAMKNLSAMKAEYEEVKDAFVAVKMKGYGVVSPRREEIRLEDPVIIRQGNKYGVRIHSEAPSIHLIRANIETEIAPIVGTEDQAKDLLTFIKQEAETEHGIWETNIFGKSVEELVMDGIRGKIAMIGDESQTKLQDTMQKIVNDSNGGMVCIII